MTFLVEGEKIPVHKAVLAMRCEYFAAMFDSELTKESEEDNVIKLNVPLKIFNMILEYIYTGHLKAEDDEEVLLALSLADEYLLSDLSAKIQGKLVPKITLENVFKIVKHSSSFGLDSTFQSCCTFIHNNLKIVLESVRLNELTANVWECILEKRIKEQSKTNSIPEIDIFKYILKWTEQKGEVIEKETASLLFSKVRLDLIDVTNWIQVVSKSNVYEAEFLLAELQKKYSPPIRQCPYCDNTINHA